MSGKPGDGFTLAAVGQALIKRDIRADRSKEFAGVVDLLRGADAAFTNFEGTIEGRHGGWPTKEGFVHTSKPLVLDALRDLGFNLLSLANNHAFDLGSAGILSSIEAARERGFACAGTGANAAEAAAPGFLDTPHGRVALVAMECSKLPTMVTARDAAEHRGARPGLNRQRVIDSLQVDGARFDDLVALSHATGNEKYKETRVKVGYQEADRHGTLDFFGALIERADAIGEGRKLHPEDRERNLATIRQAAAEAFTVAYIHHHYWEPEWEMTPLWMRAFAHDCIDAGASAFVSHGVPLLQGVEVYKGRPIFYSLGNFVFHTFRAPKYTDDRIWESMVARCEFKGDGTLKSVRMAPIAMGGEEAMADRTFGIPRDAPRRVGAAYGTKILERVKRLSATFGTEVAIADGEATILL
jgi:poly-gamma-glutamate capsule biosynthesis protein CapA/YwtB (metallophosphatase superfamily)